MRRVIEAVLKTGGYASAALIGLVTLLLIYEVGTRYFLHRPSIWALDFARYGILFLTFLGAAWLLTEEGHVKVEIATSLLNPKNQALVTGVTSVIAFLSCAVFFWEGLKITWGAYQMGQFVERSFVVPRHLVVWIMPLGTLLLCIQFARRALQHFHIFCTTDQKKRRS